MARRSGNRSAPLKRAVSSFRKSDQDALAQLKKGQVVTVVGEVDGKFMHVQLSDCQLAADPLAGQ